MATFSEIQKKLGLTPSKFDIIRKKYIKKSTRKSTGLSDQNIYIGNSYDRMEYFFLAGYDRWCCIFESHAWYRRHKLDQSGDIVFVIKLSFHPACWDYRFNFLYQKISQSLSAGKYISTGDISYIVCRFGFRNEHSISN